MKVRVCILCGKGIYPGLNAIEYDHKTFDTHRCLETFKKLKAAFGNSLAW
jgi:ribosomal protein L24E